MTFLRRTAASLAAAALALSITPAQAQAGSSFIPGSSFTTGSSDSIVNAVAEYLGGSSFLPEQTQPVDASQNLPQTFDLQSHRFGRGEWTEESTLGLAGSQALDVTTLEFDIVIAEDQTPVVWHDDTIQADKCVDTAPAYPNDPEFPYVGSYVNELDWNQLQTLNCNLPLEGFPDAVHPEVNKLMQLRDVFELTKDDDEVYYNIETKRAYDKSDHTATAQQFVDAIVPVVQKYGVTERTMIQSFDWATLPLVREQAPEIPLVMLYWGDFNYDPSYFGPVDQSAQSYFDAADQLGVEVLSPDYTIVLMNEAGEVDIDQARAYIDEAHARGFVVVPWTVNNPDHMNALIDAGIDGIITDYPTTLAGILNERGIEF